MVPRFPISRIPSITGELDCTEIVQIRHDPHPYITDEGRADLPHIVAGFPYQAPGRLTP